SVQKIWYDSNRANDDHVPNSLAARISNVIALIVVLSVVTSPLWQFIPDSLTPISTPQGKIRFAIAVFLCHLGLIFWLIATVLLVNLFRQKRLAGAFQTVALIAFFTWQAWGSTMGVIWIWDTVYHWIA